MSARSLVTWFVISIVCGVSLLIIADRRELLRLDTVATIRCVAELSRKHEAPLTVVGRLRGAIITEAERADLPPELLAAIIADHHGDLTPFRRFTDCSGSALGGNVSLGPAQVRLSTAVNVDRVSYDALSPANFRRYRARLLDPSENIRYQARELRRLLERDNRFPGISAEALIHDPVAMALLITEYRVGRIRAPIDPDIRRARAVSTLQFMHGRDLYIFGRSEDDTARIQSEIEAYLTHVNCESRNSSARACQEWKDSLSEAGS